MCELFRAIREKVILRISKSGELILRLCFTVVCQYGLKQFDRLISGSHCLPLCRLFVIASL
jgi:hypothetical protein